MKTNTLGLFTKFRRKDLGLTPSKLARKIGIPAQAIKNCEAGKPISKKARTALMKFNELEDV